MPSQQFHPISPVCSQLSWVPRQVKKACLLLLSSSSSLMLQCLAPPSSNMIAMAAMREPSRQQVRGPDAGWRMSKPSCFARYQTLARTSNFPRALWTLLYRSRTCRRLSVPSTGETSTRLRACSQSTRPCKMHTRCMQGMSTADMQDLPKLQSSIRTSRNLCLSTVTLLKAHPLPPC